MTDKQLQFLGIAAIATFIIAGFLYSGISFSGDGFVSGSPLIQGLDTNKIASISIKKGKDSLTLVKSEAGFVLQEMSNYPASLNKINNMLISVLDIRLKDKVTESKNFHKDYAIEEGSSDATLLTLFDESGAELTSIIAGNRLERGSGVYVRKNNEEVVYSTAASLSIPTESTSYLDTSIFSIETGKITSVELSRSGETFQITKEKEKLLLSKIPKGREVDEDEVKSVFEALSSVSFVEALPADTLNPDWDRGYRCNLESGLSYLVRTAEDGENILLAAQAFPPNVSEISIDRNETDEELKKKETILLDVDKANNFNSKNSVWIFKVKKNVAESLRKDSKDLLAELDEDEE